jgi:hypothetical protein
MYNAEDKLIYFSRENWVWGILRVLGVIPVNIDVHIDGMKCEAKLAEFRIHGFLS